MRRKLARKRNPTPQNPGKQKQNNPQFPTVSQEPRAKSLSVVKCKKRKKKKVHRTPNCKLLLYTPVSTERRVAGGAHGGPLLGDEREHAAAQLRRETQRPEPLQKGEHGRNTYGLAEGVRQGGLRALEDPVAGVKLRPPLICI